MSAVSTQALSLTTVRGALAAALAPRTDADPGVLPDLVDAIDPPVLLLEWRDPWLEPRTVGVGYFDALLAVLAIAGRLEPGPGIETLEALVGYTLGRLLADGHSWPVESLTAPRRFDMGGIPYLGARIVLRVPVSIETED